MCFHEAGFYHCPAVLRDLCLQATVARNMAVNLPCSPGKSPEMGNELVSKCSLSYRQSVVDSLMKRWVVG